MAHQGHSVGQAIGLITGLKDRLHGVQLLAPQIRLRPTMLHTLPQYRPLRPLGEIVVPIEVLDLVAAQDRFDHAAIALRQDVAEREEFFVIGQAARHRLAVFAHMALVAVGGNTQRAAFHRFQHEAAHFLHFCAGRLALHRFFAHHVVAHRDMAHQTADVDAHFALKVVEIFAVAMPVPLHTLLQS